MREILIQIKMKNLKSISIIALMLISKILFVNCEKESIEIQTQTLTPKLVGQIHNKVMTHFKNNYISEKNEVNNIINFNINYLNSELDSHKILLNRESDFYNLKDVFETDKLAQKYFYQKSKKYNAKSKSITDIKDYNAYQLMDYFYDNELISNSEKSILKKLIDYHKDNYELKLSDSELKTKTESLKNEFYQLNPDLNNTGKMYTAIVIELAISSNEWWAENLSTQNKSKFRKESKALIAPWIMADVIGALGSGALNIIKQGFSDSTSPVDGEQFIYAMLEGGIISSVAPWTKLRKLFSLI